VKRGEIWTASGGGYAGKPCPVVIVQDNRFSGTASITICAFTTDPTEAPLFRPLIAPDDANGLREPCRLMADKLTTVPKAKLGKRLGQLSEDHMQSLNRAMLVFLGLVGR
jgi:mRNA interferase MazF